MVNEERPEVETIEIPNTEIGTWTPPLQAVVVRCLVCNGTCHLGDMGWDHDLPGWNSNHQAQVLQLNGQVEG